jgi:hypothetical protein
MAVFDELKNIAKVLQEAGKIELYEKILAIQQQLLEMQEKIRTQGEEIRELENNFKIKGDIFFENNAYWFNKKDGSKEGPFCSGCWDSQSKQLIHLHSRMDLPDAWICPVCKIHIRTLKAPTNVDSTPHIVTRDEETY